MLEGLDTTYEKEIYFYFINYYVENSKSLFIFEVKNSEGEGKMKQKVNISHFMGIGQSNELEHISIYVNILYFN